MTISTKTTRTGALLLAVLLAAAFPANAQASTVYAKNFGYQAEDATAALQAAINSGATKVVVSNMGTPWIVRPLFLASNQELVFESGVTVEAKRGEFHGTNDSLFTADHKQNITIRAADATFKMHKEDYVGGSYSYSQWRHVFYMLSCDRLAFIGGTYRDSGGDGIFLGSFEGQPACTNVTVQNAVCDGNYRQGISVTNGENVLIDHCVLKNTSDQEPAAGIDFEPDGPAHRLVNCVVSNCRFENNLKSGLIVYPQMLNAQSSPLSITVKNCYFTSQQGWGIQISPIWAGNGVGGKIRFENCVIEDVRGPGLFVMGKAAYCAAVEFSHCTWRRCGKESFNGFPAVPLCLSGLFPEQTPEYGGIRFDKCLVEDDRDRAFLSAVAPSNSAGVANVKGMIAVVNAYGARADWGANSHDVSLEIESLKQSSSAYGAQPGVTPGLPGSDLADVGQPYSIPTLSATPKPAPVAPHVYPNPARERVTFRFQPEGREDVLIMLISAAGETVCRKNATVGAGAGDVVLDLPGVAPGVYYYLVRRPAITQRGKIAVAR